MVSKYDELFMKAKDKKDFVRMALHKFPIIKRSAERVYNKLKSVYSRKKNDTVSNVHKQESVVKTQKNDDISDIEPNLKKFARIILPNDTSLIEDLIDMPVKKYQRQYYVDIRHIASVLVKHTMILEQGRDNVTDGFIRNESILKISSETEFIKPDQLKLLTIQDMKLRGFKLSTDFLLRYGFTPAEIGWLRKEKYFEAD